MSSKMNQSLDTIMSENKTTSGNRRRGRNPRKAAVKSKAATTAVIAPSGGVQKQTRGPRGAKPVALPQTGESKISVSNLPEDVNEQLIKDYFSASVAPVRRVVLNYGPTGRSRGSCVVSFSKPTAAADAVKLDGTLVDGKPLRVELLLGKDAIPGVAPKSLQDRVSKPKNAAKEKPKEAAGAKGAAAGAAKGARATKKKSGRAGRPKAKTAEELDAEMQDYFGGDNNAAAANGTAQPAAATNGGDTGMTDEVL